MRPLPSSASGLLHSRPTRRIPSVVAPATQCLASQQRRTKASAVDQVSGQYDRTPAFDSPFKNNETNPTTKIPSFKNYMSKRPESSNKTFQYFMVGGMGLLAAAGAKAIVQGTYTDYSIRSGYCLWMSGSLSWQRSRCFGVETETELTMRALC